MTPAIPPILPINAAGHHSGGVFVSISLVPLPNAAIIAALQDNPGMRHGNSFALPG